MAAPITALGKAVKAANDLYKKTGKLPENPRLREYILSGRTEEAFHGNNIRSWDITPEVQPDGTLKVRVPNVDRSKTEGKMGIHSASRPQGAEYRLEDIATSPGAHSRMEAVIDGKLRAFQSGDYIIPVMRRPSTMPQTRDAHHWNPTSTSTVIQESNPDWVPPMSVQYPKSFDHSDRLREIHRSLKEQGYKDGIQYENWKEDIGQPSFVDPDESALRSHFADMDPKVRGSSDIGGFATIPTLIGAGGVGAGAEFARNYPRGDSRASKIAAKLRQLAEISGQDPISEFFSPDYEGMADLAEEYGTLDRNQWRKEFLKQFTVGR